MLRFLGGNRASRQGSSSNPAKDVTVRVSVPNYGGVAMIAQRIDDGTSDMPQYADRELNGALEIIVPRGSGRRRCRAIRMRLVQVCRLYMGEKRGWEKDTLFERTTENRGAILLEEGTNRFAFTIFVPYGVAPFSIHPTGDIKLSLLAEVEGLSGGQSTMPRTSETTHSMRSVYLRRGSDEGSVRTAPSSDEDGPPGFDIQPLMTMSWSEPVTAGDESVEWLKGTITGSRCICLLYNPDPDNGITKLNMRHDGAVDGMGPFEMLQTSDVWTVAAPLKSQFHAPAPGPNVAIYYVRTTLEQTAAMSSPRDPLCTPPKVTMMPFTIWEKGRKPSSNYVTTKYPALWRGTAAGGTDVGGLTLSGLGRLPCDETGRPSTLPGMMTPIKVSHNLVMDVYYTLEGLDVNGRPLSKAIAGSQLRVLRIELPVVVPSCGCIPEALDLPTYEDIDCGPCERCATCNLPPELQACGVCPLSRVPHARHDQYTHFGKDGTCPECDERFKLSHSDEAAAKWKDCACGFSFAHLAQRMARVIPDEVESVGDCLVDTPPKFLYEQENRVL